MILNVITILLLVLPCWGYGFNDEIPVLMQDLPVFLDQSASELTISKHPLTTGNFGQLPEKSIFSVKKGQLKDNEILTVFEHTVKLPESREHVLKGIEKRQMNKWYVDGLPLGVEFSNGRKCPAVLLGSAVDDHVLFTEFHVYIGYGFSGNNIDQYHITRVAAQPTKGISLDDKPDQVTYKFTVSFYMTLNQDFDGREGWYMYKTWSGLIFTMLPLTKMVLYALYKLYKFGNVKNEALMTLTVPTSPLVLSCLLGVGSGQLFEWVFWGQNSVFLSLVSSIITAYIGTRFYLTFHPNVQHSTLRSIDYSTAMAAPENAIFLSLVTFTQLLLALVRPRVSNSIFSVLFVCGGTALGVYSARTPFLAISTTSRSRKQSKYAWYNGVTAQFAKLAILWFLALSQSILSISEMDTCEDSRKRPFFLLFLLVLTLVTALNQVSHVTRLIKFQETSWHWQTYFLPSAFLIFFWLMDIFTNDHLRMGTVDYTVRAALALGFVAYSASFLLLSRIIATDSIPLHDMAKES